MDFGIRAAQSALLVSLVAACPAERRHGPDADASVADAADPTLDAPAFLPDRRVNNVIVGQTRTFWSHGEFACSLEFGCPDGPTITAWEMTLDKVNTWVDGGVGTWQLAGDETELFFVTGDNDQEMYLKRLAGSATLAFSIPRPFTMGPAVDATHVYWSERQPQGGYVLRRALRAGDGSDAEMIATTDGGTEQLTYSGGYLWWMEQQRGVVRVATTGGTPEAFALAATTIAADSAGVLVGTSTPDGNGNWIVEIGRLSGSGSYQALVTQTTAGSAPRYIVPDGNLMFWSIADGNVYYAASTGGAISTIAAQDKAGYVFAVLPDRLMVEFNRYGFRTVPR